MKLLLSHPKGSQHGQDPGWWTGRQGQQQEAEARQRLGRETHDRGGVGARGRARLTICGPGRAHKEDDAGVERGGNSPRTAKSQRTGPVARGGGDGPRCTLQGVRGTWRMDARGAQPSLNALELEFITEHLRTPERVSGEGSVHGGWGSGGGQGQVLPEPAGRTCYDKNGCPSPSFRENRLASVPIGTRVCPKSINVSQAKTYIATKGSTPPMKYSW